MYKRTLFSTLAIGALACSNIVSAQAQQSSAASGQAGVVSAAPIHSPSMAALERSAQRLREAIQSLAQQPPGLGRDQAISNARRALRDAQQAMIQLPPGYRVSGVAVSNAPLAHANPARDRAFGDAMRALELAADRLRDSIDAMSQRPAGERRDDAIREAHAALFETQRAMAWVRGSGPAARAGQGGAGASPQGTVSMQPGSGSVSGGISAGSDASEVQAAVPAVAGGVGLNARAMLSNEARSDQNVKMVFSLSTGNYVADVDVHVKDQKGRTMIDGYSDGPWLYAKLPPGDYTAVATYNGHKVTRKFSVGRSGQRVAHFRWPASVEQAEVSGVAPILRMQ